MITLKQSPQTIKNAQLNSAIYRKFRGWVSMGGILRTVRRVKVKMRQLDTGEWQMKIGNSESWLAPTDVEVSLWLELEECRRANST